VNAHSRIKRLLLLFGIVVLIGLLRPFWGPRYDRFFNTHYNRQLVHLRQIEEHIRAIRPQWNAFTNQNSGFEMVELFAYTGDDGLFGASGPVPTEEHLSKLRKFMEDTRPPRPIFMNVEAIGREPFELLKKSKEPEPSGPANGSQPIRSETNRTSSFHAMPASAAVTELSRHEEKLALTVAGESARGRRGRSPSAGSPL
jgi:hypothetical protein